MSLPLACSGSARGRAIRQEIAPPSITAGRRHEWDAETIVKFKGMFDGGVRLSLIAATFHISKTRISAKVQELGWSRATVRTSHDPKVAEKAVKRGIQPTPDARFFDPVSQMSAKPEDGISFWELGSRSCRWPIYGNGIDMRFCGQEKWDELEECSYCKDHYKRSRASFNQIRAEEAA